MTQNDTRTADEKWNDSIHEASIRGYWFKLQNPPPGPTEKWSSTKRRPNIFLETLAPQTTRGIVPENYRDDTEDVLETTVQTLMPINGNENGNHTTTLPTIRTTYVKGLPVRINSGGRPHSGIHSFHQGMTWTDQWKWEENKEVEDKGGPKWREWCQLEDQHLWKRFRLSGLYCHDPHSLEPRLFSEIGYQLARGATEHIAHEQKIPSWSIQHLNNVLKEKKAIAQRFKNRYDQLPFDLRDMMEQGRTSYDPRDSEQWQIKRKPPPKKWTDDLYVDPCGQLIQDYHAYKAFLDL